ncbi:ABC transporter ABCA1 lipid exporter family [Phytophthora cinnamomi]|uniref:ABC transporter ABCA1 lipid exporter family n=1 Tax=Phytophthora cinnamomi TaxID=4785 RepID=UPI0035594382|nr:ABC transporter ABCA1 lipid exporter family [Phytophthora cinnamomi]KAG6619112.1 ABC transporter ABCA1 lipid exporter family [Phytophthora cinnamomi]
MKFFFHIAAAAVMLLTSDTDASWGIYELSEKFGEPHGTYFSDTTFAIARQSVHSVTIRTGERVNGVGIDVTSPDGKRNNPFHGGNGGSPQTLTLNSGERFQCLEAHWGKYKGRTRIFYIKISTTGGRSIAGGTPTIRVRTVCAPAGFQLGGFSGSSGKELDQVGAVWTMN